MPDIGGFHRSALKGDLNEMYTQWFANASLFDVPVRPHTDNLCKCNETAPDRIGDKKSNLWNLRTRYQLIPYYYSLAYEAYLHATAVVAPLVYYFQTDPVVRTMGHEKMIGPYLLAALVAKHGERARDVYLPQGTWFDFYSGEKYEAGWHRDVAEYKDGIFRLPLFVKSGAVLPQAHIDELTLNALGLRGDHQVRNEMILSVYPDLRPSSFTLFDDDGESVNYQKGEFSQIEIDQVELSDRIIVTVHRAQGHYALPLRSYVLDLHTENPIQTVLADHKRISFEVHKRSLRVRLGELHLEGDFRVEFIKL